MATVDQSQTSDASHILLGFPPFSLCGPLTRAIYSARAHSIDVAVTRSRMTPAKEDEQIAGGVRLPLKDEAESKSGPPAAPDAGLADDGKLGRRCRALGLGMAVAERSACRSCVRWRFELSQKPAYNSSSVAVCWKSSLSPDR
ncbi:hypothetical protein OPV22_023769 [Ensete ventricosum]|uniref:Uncharacterized protein n=1 Tax=Ensete ventricosum TaxID=4639 RepID=A0AAV8QMK2_ENSVE|nr:hypothetical protein OPV22_023769 [Ensete ventricosum]